MIYAIGHKLDLTLIEPRNDQISSKDCLTDMRHNSWKCYLFLENAFIFALDNKYHLAYDCHVAVNILDNRCQGHW